MLGKLTIGKLAKITGLTAVTIRYYERCKLLPKSIRSAGGYRLYPDTIIFRLQFIKNAKNLGFTLEEIQDLLGLQSIRTASRKEVKAFTATKLQLVRDKIKSLKQIEQALEFLTSSCNGKGALHDCPILMALYDTAPSFMKSKKENTK